MAVLRQDDARMKSSRISEPAERRRTASRSSAPGASRELAVRPQHVHMAEKVVEEIDRLHPKFVDNPVGQRGAAPYLSSCPNGAANGGQERRR